jgi:hypothetical protein
MVSLLTEQLVQMGLNVTLFATGDSQTSGQLVAVCPRAYSEDPSVVPKVAECLHVSEVFERAADFDLIHNHFDFLPLTYSGLVETPMLTTIHGFSSPSILPVYRKYNDRSHYVAISEADKSPELGYLAQSARRTNPRNSVTWPRFTTASTSRNFRFPGTTEIIFCFSAESTLTRVYTKLFKWRGGSGSNC